MEGIPVLIFILPSEPLEFSSGPRLLFLSNGLSSQTITAEEIWIPLNNRSFLRTYSHSPQRKGTHLTRAPAWSPLCARTGVCQSSLLFGGFSVRAESSRGMLRYSCHLLVTPSAGGTLSQGRGEPRHGEPSLVDMRITPTCLWIRGTQRDLNGI